MSQVLLLTCLLLRMSDRKKEVAFSEHEQASGVSDC